MRFCSCGHDSSCHANGEGECATGLCGCMWFDAEESECPDCGDVECQKNH